MNKRLWTGLTLLLAGCGLISPQSVYEGLRTQQNVKDAGTQPPPEKLDPYDAYEKARAKIKSEEGK